MPRTGVFVTSDFILDPWLDQVADALVQKGFDVVRGPRQVPPAKTRFSAQELPKYFGDTDLVITTTRSIIGADALAAGRRLRGVVFPTIGTESIDLEAANQLGIAVAHGPTPENFNSMAESTVLLMLALLYDLHGTERILRENLPRPRLMTARMMMNKTVGLIGFGRIARGIAQRLSGWGVNLVVYDPYLPAGQLPEGIRQADLATLLKESDIVSLHTTLTAESRHMINDDTLALMKPTSYFINTARGGMVDEAAMFRALAAKRIAGAALDAFELEPLPPDHPLRTLDNVILTPHMVGHTKEIFDAIPGTVMQNVEKLLDGQPPLYFRNPDVLPKWQARLSALQKQ